MNKEPKKADVLSIAEYLGCNAEELWSEVSKLLSLQDKYSRYDELTTILYDHEHDDYVSIPYIEKRLRLCADDAGNDLLTEDSEANTEQAEAQS
jgi:hypothetical protein